VVQSHQLCAVNQANRKCFDTSEVVRMLYNRVHHVKVGKSDGTVVEPVPDRIASASS